MRPRDLIQLCNLCRDSAQNEDHQNIEISDFFNALPQYSDWKLKDLRDEYRVQYPFLQKVFLALFYRKSPHFGRKEVVEFFEPVKAKLIDEFGDRYFDPLDNLLQVLYNIGFLGAVLNGRTLYSFDDEKVLAAYVVNFEIHPAFRLALATEELIDYEIGFIDQTAGEHSVQIRAGSDIVVKQDIGEVSGGTVVGGINGQFNLSSDDAIFEKLFDLLEETIKARPEDPNVDKQEIQEMVKLIKIEVARREGVNENKLVRWIRNLLEIAPDIVDVMAVWLGGSVSGFAVVFKKIVAKEKRKIENRG